MSEVADKKPEAGEVDLKALKTNIDVLILMDCTGSMGSWIQAAKTTAVATATQIREEMPNADFRLGFVGYRDHCDSDKYITIPFSGDVAAVQAQLQSVYASGGGDAPEDVAGGLQLSLDAEWRGDATKIVIMVADAPCHGTQYHDYGSGGDNHPGGDPTGKVPEEQLRELAKRGADFYFIKCTTATDKMLKIFNDAFEGARANEEQIFCILDLQNQSGGDFGGPPGAMMESVDGLCPVPGYPSASALPSPMHAPAAYLEMARGASDCSDAFASGACEPCVSGVCAEEEDAPSRASIAVAPSRRMEMRAPMAPGAPMPYMAMSAAAPMAPAAYAAPSSTSDSFLKSVTASVKRSVVARSKAPTAM